MNPISSNSSGGGDTSVATREGALEAPADAGISLQGKVAWQSSLCVILAANAHPGQQV